MNASTQTHQSPPGPAEVWSTGNYADVCDTMIPTLGAQLVQLARVRAGEKVLDVAAGSGNATLPAAAIGARVTALDITPRLLDVGAERAARAGLEVTWVNGDAHALPFADAEFDCVLSCVGVQFCADAGAAARELLRTCRPGGRIALIAWTPEGFIGQILAAVSSATGASRSTSSPLTWGRESGVRELFANGACAIAFGRAHVEMPATSPSAWVDYMAGAYGPMVRARRALEQRDGWTPLREVLIGIAASHNVAAGDGGYCGRAEYLTALLDC